MDIGSLVYSAHGPGYEATLLLLVVRSVIDKGGHEFRAFPTVTRVALSGLNSAGIDILYDRLRLLKCSM